VVRFELGVPPVKQWVRSLAFALDFGLAANALADRSVISHAAAYDEATGAMSSVAVPAYVAASPDAQATAVRYLMAVAWLETNYGYGWGAVGTGSNNMGAITGTYQGQFFEHQDSRPDENGDGDPEVYITRFRRYPSRGEGWADLARVVFRRQDTLQAALAGDADGVSRGLYRARYYLGTSTDPEVNVARHKAAVASAIGKASVELGPVPLSQDSGLVTESGSVVQHLPSSQASGIGLVVLLGLGGLAWWRIRRRAG
jgi:MYXO-CTERM domain-containing protein